MVILEPIMEIIKIESCRNSHYKFFLCSYSSINPLLQEGSCFNYLLQHNNRPKHSGLKQQPLHRTSLQMAYPHDQLGLLQKDTFGLVHFLHGGSGVLEERFYVTGRESHTSLVKSWVFNVTFCHMGQRGLMSVRFKSMCSHFLLPQYNIWL